MSTFTHTINIGFTWSPVPITYHMLVEKTSQELRIAALRVVGCKGVEVIKRKTTTVTTVIITIVTI